MSNYTKQEILEILTKDSNTITTWNGENIFNEPLTIFYSFFSQLPDYYLNDNSDAAPRYDAPNRMCRRKEAHRSSSQKP